MGSPGGEDPGAWHNIDTTAKPKERLKLLASMAEDGFQPAGIADLYRRRGGQIVELYKAQIQYLSSSAVYT
ncbi:hypothetical protein DIPPA_28359 [Diplonema papillatum]|nr:hypothetical protein DIPPA_28359 [Diplonema papillatum]